MTFRKYRQLTYLLLTRYAGQLNLWKFLSLSQTFELEKISRRDSCDSFF
jgi:hypothetical protein